MRVTRFQGEASLKELVARLYNLGPDGPTPAAAATALAEANRHLPLRSRSLAASVPEGTILAVPELSGAADVASSAPVQGVAARVIRARATALLDRVAADFQATSGRDADELTALATLIESRQWKAAAKKDDTIAAAVKQVGAAIDDRRARLDAVDGVHRRTLEHARRAVDRLAGSVAPAPEAGGATAAGGVAGAPD